MPIPRLLVAGQSSGVGKTTITAGLITALRKRALAVQPFKCGPDYIDPTYLTAAACRPCRNLDTWMLTAEQIIASFDRACAGADIAIIEGVMGLYDGATYGGETGSAAHVAKLLGATVLLVLDVSKLARSAAALALGYQKFDPSLRLGAFLLNRAGSDGHGRGCAQAITQATGLPVLGWLPKQSNLHVPERHLGLIPTGERAGLENFLQAAGDVIETWCQVDDLVRIARDGCECRSTENLHPSVAMPQSSADGSPLPVLAVAKDEAFSFYYPENLELLEAAGARVHFFSPLRGEGLPAETAGVYFGGGFPEVYAEQLSKNVTLWAQLRRLHAMDAPIYAECGGFMALTEALVDADGKHWPMAGLVPGETHMQTTLTGLGYRLATACGENLLLQAGETVRGHEFHYSSWQVEPTKMDRDKHSAWLLRRHDQDDPHLDGYSCGNLLASYLHVHFAQRPALARRFVVKLERAYTSTHSTSNTRDTVPPGRTDGP